MSIFRSGSILFVFTTLVFGATNTVAEETDLSTETDPNNAVTFFAIVDANSSETSLNAMIGETQTTSEQLTAAIRTDSDRVLRITSIQGQLFGSPLPPAETDYALAFIAACSPRLSVRGFGNGYIAFSGPNAVQVTYRPGLVVRLAADETLCLRSLTQSNQRVLIEVHGYLQHSVAKK